MRREWVLGTAVASVVAVSALAGCDGGDDAATTTTPVPQTAASTQPAEPMAESVTTIASTTTTPATATTAPPTTTEPTTTLPAETVPPPTDPPTSTTLPDGVPPRLTFPDDPDKQAVVDAVYAYFDGLNAAQAEPGDDDARNRVLATTTAPIRERVSEYLDRLMSDGEAFVDLGAETTSIDIFEEVVSVVSGAALVDACVVDRTSHIRVGDDVSDSGRLIDDQVVAAVLSYSVTKTEQGWRVSDLAVVSRVEGQERCE